PGCVHLVGAGPGAPGLLTARAIELIARADTILYDRLIPASALDGARVDAELLFVGKEGGGEAVPQERTTALLIERAREGREVVRLKGGDPFVFGRGGEEALALRKEGIDFHVVPGVTAGVAAAAYAGIPVTHRGLSTAVALVTGHEDPDKLESELDWEALGGFPGTLVFYMGVGALEGIARSLIDAGRPESQPVAVVERGTMPTQRTVTGTLGTIAEVARREQVKAPAVTIVGAVAKLSEDLRWLPALPLSGLRVAVTRARTQASELARRLEDLGAEVVQAPTIRMQPISEHTPLDPSSYDLVCVTSPNGVRFLFERLEQGGRDARSLTGACVAAIGPGTARALRERGILADVVPERFVAESLVEALADVDASRALVARASEARDVLPDALRARGIDVDVVALYETLAEPLSPRAREQARSADYITFTSSSTVRFFLEATSEDGDAALSPSTRIVSIGPVTSATLKEHGLEPHVEAIRHDIDGLVEALLADAAGDA
ncbi:MAG: uroporphyrinogen-III C-methyltransferase, partial [Solirubrobacteraceae bacterium]